MPHNAQPGPTILVVEDEWFVRMSIVEYFEARDWRVIEARDGDAAAAILQHRDGIDLVFTDIRLGRGLNGWEVGEISRRTYRNIPVVYPSAAVDLPERPVPGSVFIAKPYAPERVLAICRELCAARNPDA